MLDLHKVGRKYPRSTGQSAQVFRIDSNVRVAPSFVVLCDDSFSVEVSTWYNCFVNALNVRVG